MAFAYHLRKKACLFIPVAQLRPVSRLELEDLRPAGSRLLTEVVMESLQNDRLQDPGKAEPCAPITVYKHTFSFQQLQ